MPIQNSVTGEVLRSYSINELKQQAALMRGYDLAALCAATSGHAGGTLSIMDITAASASAPTAPRTRRSKTCSPCADCPT